MEREEREKAAERGERDPRNMEGEINKSWRKRFAERVEKKRESWRESRGACKKKISERVKRKSRSV